MKRDHSKYTKERPVGPLPRFDLITYPSEEPHGEPRTEREYHPEGKYVEAADVEKILGHCDDVYEEGWGGSLKDNILCHMDAFVDTKERFWELAVQADAGHTRAVAHIVMRAFSRLVDTDDDIQKLLLAVNGVTCGPRHGQIITKARLDHLQEVQDRLWKEYMTDSDTDEPVRPIPVHPDELMAFVLWLSELTPGAHDSSKTVFVARDMLLKGRFRPKQYKALTLQSFEEKMTRRLGTRRTY